MRTVQKARVLSNLKAIFAMLVLLSVVGGCNIKEEVVSRDSGEKFTGKITSLSDFDRVMQTYITPLDKLPTETLQEFRNSLSFKNGGLAGFKYGNIKKALSETDYIKTMALFGINAPLTTRSARLAAGAIEGEGDPLIDYYCYSKGTCKRARDYACTSNC